MQEYIDGEGHSNNDSVAISPSRSGKNALDEGIGNEEKSDCSRGKGKLR